MHRAVSTLFGGTPGRIRLYGGGCALLCLAFGLYSGLAAWSSGQAMQRAQSDTRQVVRADALAANLLLADATATNTYLQVGTEEGSRAAYDDAIVEATRLVAESAAAQPGDAEALAVLNSEIEDYSELAEHARAANRQGLVVGQRYQQQASGELRDQALPVIAAIREANLARVGVSDRLGETDWPLVQLAGQALAGLLTAALLATFWRWLARRTRRRVNPGLALAAGLLTVGLLFALAVQAAGALRMRDFREGLLAETTNLSQARTALYDARANESLTLIARGSGQGPEEAWRRAVAQADELLTGRPAEQAALAAYAAQHRRVRELDDVQGDWAGAVALAVDPHSSRFAPVDLAVSQAAQDAAGRASDALDSRGLLLTVQGLLPVIGLAAAAALVRGLAPRIEEYL